MLVTGSQSAKALSRKNWMFQNLEMADSTEIICKNIVLLKWDFTPLSLSLVMFSAMKLRWFCLLLFDKMNPNGKISKSSFKYLKMLLYSLT